MSRYSLWGRLSACRRLSGGVLLAAAILQAHEIGTTRVSVLLQERAYTIEVVTDAGALLQKLSAATGFPTPDGAGSPELESMLSRLDEKFRQRVHIVFDAMDAHPAIEYSVKPGAGAAAGAVATIRLRGNYPQSARHFTWNYGWTFASYSMTVRNGASGNPSTEWLEGNQTSAPFALASPEPLH